MEFIELFTNILTVLFLVVLLSRDSGCGKHKDDREGHSCNQRKEV